MNLVPLDEHTVAGIRPEHMRLDPEENADTPLVDLQVTIEHQEYLGSEWLIHATTASGTAGKPQHVTTRLPATSQPAWETGQTCRMTGNAEHVCLFDATSGARKPSNAGALA